MNAHSTNAQALTLKTVEELVLTHSIVGFSAEFHRVQRFPSDHPMFSYDLCWSVRSYGKVTFASAKRLMKALKRQDAKLEDASIFTSTLPIGDILYSDVTLTYSVEPNYRTR